MTDAAPSRITELRQHEEELVFPAFDRLDAWRLGSLIANHAVADGHPVAIDIRRHNVVLFHCVLPGATADQEEWVRRKSATTLRFEDSTAVLAEEFAAKAFDPRQGGWLALQRTTRWPEDHSPCASEAQGSSLQ